MSSPALPLQSIVDVTVIAGPALGNPPLFNQGIIIGPSAVIPSYGSNPRLRQYQTLSAMLTDGFTTTSPEYLAAQLYFGQSEPPNYLWVGRRDLTSLNTVIPHSGAAGTGYAVGDVIVVVQSGASQGQCEVTTIGAGGAVTGLAVFTPPAGTDGTGYSTATGLATTTTGAGTGLEVDITAVGETYLVALIACRAASSVFWGVMCCNATTADAEAIAPYVEAATPPTFYFHTTADTAVLNNTSGNLALTLKGDEYENTALIYSTTQSGVAPNNAYGAAALMGSVVGQNTGLPNSYFTEWGKTLIGIQPEPLSQAQVNTITGNNCNVYVGYANTYTLVTPGITPSGLYIDQVLNRAILAAAIQYAVMNLLIASPSVPQTDPGETQLIHAVNGACQAAVNTGYLAPGTYNGVNSVLALSPGDPLPAGYLSQAYPYSTQSLANKAARRAMPIYTVINEAGAVQSVVIGIVVNL
jgi:Protein of unknown function (DUF3383)